MPTALLALLLACAPNPPTTPAAAPEPPARVETDATPTPALDAENPVDADAEPAGAEPSDGDHDGEPAEADPDEPAPPEPALIPAPTGVKKGGESCLVADECASGVCEGEGCGDDQPGTCAPEMRACTRDLRPYCGCDGETFSAGGNCSLRRYAYKGMCMPAE